MKRLLLSFALLLGTVSHAYAGGDYTGKWLVESKKSIVDIQQCDDSLCGTITWLKEPLDENGNEKVDKNNQDASQQSRKLMGIQMIWGFKSEDGKWVDGKIYNPNDGKIYDSEMALNDDGTLALKGCVWIICKTQTWTRAE